MIGSVLGEHRPHAADEQHARQRVEHGMERESIGDSGLHLPLPSAVLPPFGSVLTDPAPAMIAHPDDRMSVQSQIFTATSSGANGEMLVQLPLPQPPSPASPADL